LGAVSLGDEEWDGGAAMRDAFIIWLGSVPFHVSTHTIPADP